MRGITMILRTVRVKMKVSNHRYYEAPTLCSTRQRGKTINTITGHERLLKVKVWGSLVRLAPNVIYMYRS